MTRADINELSGRRMKFARLYAVLALAYLVLVACLGVAIAVLKMSRGAHPVDLNISGLLLLSIGAALTTQVHLAAEGQPIRYSVGPLVVRRRPGRLMILLAASVLHLIGFGLIAVSVFQLIGGGLMVALAFLCGVALIGGLVLTVVIARELLRGEPIVVVSEQGIFAPSAMRRPVAWEDIESVPVAASGTPLLIALKTRKGRENYRSFWSRPVTKIATHAVYARAADATQADLLLAIANYKPALIDALTLPAARGLRSAISPARTI